jgi:hypothetical protein
MHEIKIRVLHKVYKQVFKQLYSTIMPRHEKTSLGRNVYDHVSHLETAHDVCLKLCNTYVGSSKIKSSQESLDYCFARFESIVSCLHSCGPLV